MDDLKQRIRAQALTLGFVRCGFAAATATPHGDALRRWIDAGRHGSMAYMERAPEQRTDPRHLLPEARSVIVVAASYSNPLQREAEPGGDQPVGRIARYARGQDYHLVLRQRLTQLATWLEQQTGPDTKTRVVVDTAPLLERELAMSAGIGFIGKNTMLIVPAIGSYVLLAELLTSLPLDADSPARPRCGSCDLCLGACPTAAFVEPYQLDARRCISYLTIEHRGDIAPDLRPQMDNWLFGCDVCQQACPYNTPTRRPPVLDEQLAPSDGPAGLALDSALRLRSSTHRRLVRGRALTRTSRATLVRNAAIVAGNHAPQNESLDASLAVAAADANAICRETVCWAQRKRIGVL